MGNGKLKIENGNSSIQQFINSTIQQFNNSTIQQFNNSTIQQFNNSTIQQIIRPSFKVKRWFCFSILTVKISPLCQHKFVTCVFLKLLYIKRVYIKDYFNKFKPKL
jgi:hypothetical protein